MRVVAQPVKINNETRAKSLIPDVICELCGADMSAVFFLKDEEFGLQFARNMQNFG